MSVPKCENRRAVEDESHGIGREYLRLHVDVRRRDLLRRELEDTNALRALIVEKVRALYHGLPIIFLRRATPRPVP